MTSSHLVSSCAIQACLLLSSLTSPGLSRPFPDIHAYRSFGILSASVFDMSSDCFIFVFHETITWSCPFYIDNPDGSLRVLHKFIARASCNVASTVTFPLILPRSPASRNFFMYQVREECPRMLQCNGFVTHYISGMLHNPLPSVSVLWRDTVSRCQHEIPPGTTWEPLKNPDVPAPLPKTFRSY